MQQTNFNDLFESGKLNIPPPVTVPSRDIRLPYVFIGDEAFALKENLMKPYTHKKMTHDEKIFNYRLSRAKRVVENAFGILATRFRCLQTSLGMDLAKVNIIVLTCCTLYNYLRKTNGDYYLPHTSIVREDTESGQITESEWRKESVHLTSLQRRIHGTPPSLASQVRDSFKTYFNNEGSVPFQEQMMNRR